VCAKQVAQCLALFLFLVLFGARKSCAYTGIAFSGFEGGGQRLGVKNLFFFVKRANLQSEFLLNVLGL